jgi:ribosome-associated heat shock protein Hsp15
MVRETETVADMAVILADLEMAERVDKWLWAVRVYKTRTRAGDACSTGRVLVNGVVAKPATKIDPGDIVTAHRRDRTIVYVVREPIAKRVSARRAAECVEDRSPPPVPRDRPASAVFARRDQGSGRPTKRDRREIDRLRGRD